MYHERKNEGIEISKETLLGGGYSFTYLEIHQRSNTDRAMQPTSLHLDSFKMDQVEEPLAKAKTDVEGTFHVGYEV